MGDWNMNICTGHSNPVNRNGMQTNEKSKIRQRSSCEVKILLTGIGDLCLYFTFHGGPQRQKFNVLLI
jgi:hypothetical protein